MIGKPKVSVCVPTYNRSRLVAECIASIRQQTFEDFELIVVDNASTDDTEAVVRSIADARIRYERNPENVGMTRNWNRCLDLAQGEYVSIFHDDDVMMPCNLGEKVRALEENPAVGMVASLAHRIDEEGRQLEAQMEVAVPVCWLVDHPGRILAGDVSFWASTVLVRRSLYEEVGNFDTTLEYLPDVDMWFRVAARYPVLCINRYLVKYRGHEGNTSRILAAIGATEAEHVKLLSKYFDRAEPALAPYRHAAYFNMYVRTAGMYMYADRLAEARRLYVQALWCDPVRFIREMRPLIFLTLSCFGPATFSLARRVRHARLLRRLGGDVRP